MFKRDNSKNSSQSNSPDRPKKWDRELWAIAVVYFVQGAMTLSSFAVSFFLKDELHLGPAEVASLVGIAMIPWTVKPLYGMISDSLPIFGYRRRPYLLLAAVLGVSAWLGMAFGVNDTFWAITAITAGSLSVACSDAITDALVVARARLEPDGDAGNLQSFTWMAISIGGIVASYLSGYLIEHVGIRNVFALTALLPLVAGLATFAISDYPMSHLNPVMTGDAATDQKASSRLMATIKTNLGQFKQAFTNKAILLPAAFIFLWQASPGADTAFFYFSTNELHFNPEFLGTVKFVTSWAGLLGVWMFQRFLKAVPMRKLFFWTISISTLLGLTSLILITHWNRKLGISDQWFSLGDSLVLTIAGRIAYMPILVLAARLCPEGIEATLFAVLMSVLNIAALSSYQLGALLTHWFGVTETNFDNLALLVTVTNLSSLLPLPFLRWLPDESSVPQAVDSQPTPLGDQLASLAVHQSANQSTTHQSTPVPSTNSSIS
ncbi:MAG: folate/biopterin family MFS transporter [Pseudanabaenaceae cyanobacterium]